jgi:hypothetical protein
MARYTPYRALVEELSGHAGCRSYGRSVQGRPLQAVELGTEGPRLLVTAGLHGIEWIGIAVAMEVLRMGPIPGARLLVCPVLNPDGVARTEATGGHASVGSLRKNANGVDLNRNFPLPYGTRPSRIPFAGAMDPTSATYRGPAPLSEPESRALLDLLADDPPHGAINLHSFMGTFIAARVWHREDWSGYRRIVGAGRRAGAPYRRLGTPVLDVFTGELEDWLHHALGCWAVCMECFTVGESLRQHLRAPSAFARFNPADPRGVVDRDAPAVRAMLDQSLTMPRPPRRPGADRVVPWGPRALTDR